MTREEYDSKKKEINRVIIDASFYQVRKEKDGLSALSAFAIQLPSSRFPI